MSLGKVARKLKRVGKVAVQFRFTSTFEYIELKCNGTWRPDNLRVIWLRSHRRVQSIDVQWVPTEDRGPNGAEGKAVFNPPLSVALIVTLYRADTEGADFEPKEYKYYIENDGPSGKKILASFNCDMAEYVGIPTSKSTLDMTFKSVSRKIDKAILGITLESQFIKQGNSLDDDMQSTFSSMSAGRDSLAFDDEDDDEEAGAPAAKPPSPQLSKVTEEVEPTTESPAESSLVTLGTGQTYKRLTLPRRAPSKPPRTQSLHRSKKNQWQERLTRIPMIFVTDGNKTVVEPLLSPDTPPVWGHARAVSKSVSHVASIAKSSQTPPTADSESNQAEVAVESKLVDTRPAQIASSDREESVLKSEPNQAPPSSKPKATKAQAVVTETTPIASTSQHQAGSASKPGPISDQARVEAESESADTQTAPVAETNHAQAASQTPPTQTPLTPNENQTQVAVELVLVQSAEAGQTGQTGTTACTDLDQALAALRKSKRSRNRKAIIVESDQVPVESDLDLAPPPLKTESQSSTVSKAASTQSGGALQSESNQSPAVLQPRAQTELESTRAQNQAALKSESESKPAQIQTETSESNPSQSHTQKSEPTQFQSHTQKSESNSPQTRTENLESNQSQAQNQKSESNQAQTQIQKSKLQTQSPKPLEQNRWSSKLAADPLKTKGDDAVTSPGPLALHAGKENVVTLKQQQPSESTAETKTRAEGKFPSSPADQAVATPETTAQPEGSGTGTGPVQAPESDVTKPPPPSSILKKTEPLQEKHTEATVTDEQAASAGVGEEFPTKSIELIQKGTVHGFIGKFEKHGGESPSSPPSSFSKKHQEEPSKEQPKEPPKPEQPPVEKAPKQEQPVADERVPSASATRDQEPPKNEDQLKKEEQPSSVEKEEGPAEEVQVVVEDTQRREESTVKAEEQSGAGKSVLEKESENLVPAKPPRKNSSKRKHEVEAEQNGDNLGEHESNVQPSEPSNTYDAFDFVFEASKLVASQMNQGQAQVEPTPTANGEPPVSRKRTTIQSKEEYVPPPNPYLEDEGAEEEVEPPSPTAAWLGDAAFVDCFGESVGRQKLDNAEIIGLYFSANWCPPCRRFLPKLVKFYHHLKQHNKLFEILYISSDYSKQEMLRYMEEQQMPWVGLAFDSSIADKLRADFSVSAIPLFTVVSTSGTKLEESAKKSVEAATSSSGVLKLYNKWYEKLQGGGADVSTEEKQKKGLFKKVKDAVRSPSKDDTVELDSQGSPTQERKETHEASARNRQTVEDRSRTSRSKRGTSSSTVLEEREERIHHLEEVNMSLKHTNDDLNEEVAELKRQLAEATQKLGDMEESSRRLEDEKRELIANLNIRGWLFKRGLKGPTANVWRRRYFRCDQGSKIYYYKSATEGQPQGFIDLDKVISCQEVSAAQQDKNHATFLVQCDGRTYQLQAHDEATMRKWMSAIEYMRAWRKRHGTVTAGTL